MILETQIVDVTLENLIETIRKGVNLKTKDYIENKIKKELKI